MEEDIVSPIEVIFPDQNFIDALSHILVSEKDTVQLIDVDGNFLSYLLLRPPGIFYPYSLSYDARSHRLWVAARNVICVYMYITRQDFLAGKVYKSKNRKFTKKIKTDKKNYYIIFLL